MIKVNVGVISIGSMGYKQSIQKKTKPILQVIVEVKIHDLKLNITVVNEI